MRNELMSNSLILCKISGRTKRFGPRFLISITRKIKYSCILDFRGQEEKNLTGVSKK
jgi:hypothetical protein